MKRIIIIGSPGSGKSTLSKLIAKKLKLPLIHLDKIFWNSGWTYKTRDEFDNELSKELIKDKWIIDGNYSRTIKKRLQYADTAIFLDYPTATCVLRVLKRVITNYGKCRSDMGNDCPERFDFEFLRYVKNFNKNNRSHIISLLKNAKDTKIITIKNNKELKIFINSL